MEQPYTITWGMSHVWANSPEEAVRAAYRSMEKHGALYFLAKNEKTGESTPVDLDKIEEEENYEV
jgi:hypothetical protein